MKRLASRIILPVVASFLLPLSAHAQVFRAYVASYGNDANPCSVTQPCRLLPAAVNAITAGGEIWMLDSANFNSGTVTFSKDAKVLAVPGQIGSIVAVASSPAVVIAAGHNVTFRNVVIANNAANPGTDGIQMTTGSVTISDSLIGVVGTGIDVNGGGLASVDNVTFRGVNSGVYAHNGGTADVSRSKFTGCTFAGAWANGDVASTSSVLNVSSSSFVECYVGALGYSQNATGTARVMVTGSSFAHGTHGVVAQSNAGAAVVVTVSGSAALNNLNDGFAQFATGAVLESQGNNTVRGNGSNTIGTITAAGGT